MSVETGSNVPLRKLPPIPRGQLMRECSKQISSVLPTFLILTSCSFQYSWTVTKYVYIFYTYLSMSWFIGALLGGLVSSFLVYKIPKKAFCCGSAALSVFSAALFIALEDSAGIIAARYISGIGYGLLFVPGVIHAAEISDKRFRGALCSIVNLGPIIAIFLGSIVFVTTIEHNLVYGIMTIVFAIIGAVSSFWMVESPTYLVMKHDESAAEKSFLLLRKVDVASPGILDELQEVRSLVSESKLESRSPISEGNLKPLIAITLIRIVYAFSMSSPLVIKLTLYFAVSDAAEYSLMIVILLRLIFVIISVIFIDSMGHFPLMNRSMVPAGFFLFLFITILEITGYISTVKFVIICIALYQMFTGVGLDCGSSTYLGQAFPISKKSTSVFIVFATEMIIHIAALGFYDIESYGNGQFFGVGAITMIVGFTTCWLLTDTTQISLGETQKLLRGS